MIDDRPAFQSGVVRPMECLRGGWELIKDQYWLFLGISLVGVLIAGAAPMAILAGPMMCGIYICLLRHARGKPVQFDMLFRGFNYFMQSFIATLIMIIPVLVIMIPAYITFFAVMISQMPPPGQPGQNAPPPNPDAFANIMAAYAVFLLVVLIVSIVISVLFFFTYPLIVDRKLTGVQAVGASFRAARANFGGVLGLVILLNLLGIVGAMACYVGAIFVLPIHVAAVAVAYRQVFPRDDESMPTNDRDEDPRPVTIDD